MAHLSTQLFYFIRTDFVTFNRILLGIGGISMLTSIVATLFGVIQLRRLRANNARLIIELAGEIKKYEISSKQAARLISALSHQGGPSASKPDSSTKEIATSH
jgi:hypothetical protein